MCGDQWLPGRLGCPSVRLLGYPSVRLLDGPSVHYLPQGGPSVRLLGAWRKWPRVAAMAHIGLPHVRLPDCLKLPQGADRAVIELSQRGTVVARLSPRTRGQDHAICWYATCLKTWSSHMEQLTAVQPQLRC